MKRLFVTVVLATALSMSFGCLKRWAHLQNQKTVKNDLKVYGQLDKYDAQCDNVVYNLQYASGVPDDGRLMLDVYFDDHDGLEPAIVNIHGGGWEIGDKSDVNSLFRSGYMAHHGYVVFNVNYRMLPRHAITDQVNDVMGAVIWVKEHARDYGADPERVGVMGGSAGGHLGAMVAWASDDPYFVPTGHADSKLDSDVMAAVLFYGVFDLEDTLSKFPRDRETGLKREAYRWFTGVKKGPAQDEIFRHISPRYHVHPGLVPTFFVCGDEDNFHLYSESVEYEKKLQEAGVETGLYTAKGGDHGFDRFYGEQRSIGAMEATKAWFDKYLKG